MYRESSRLYEEEMCFETNEYILNRRLSIDEESNILLRSRLRNVSDWRLPGMIIRPGRESFVEDLVPMDPLYLVDHHQELLDPGILKFTVEYQRRLRPYVVKEYHSNAILELLPDDQFGIIFAYNYFNYKPMEIIQRYLTEVFKKLRPGGVFIFTFNDCNRAHAVALAEQHFMCYTPGKEIQAYAETLGYELTPIHHGTGDLSWIELRKPGEIRSIRGGQSLARIVANSK
jgi:SAM-dependent methyltransferase